MINQTAYRERRSCNVLKPANDWLRIMPLGPPGECVPDAMISGTRDDTPGGDTRQKCIMGYAADVTDQ